MTNPGCVDHVIELPHPVSSVLATGAWFKNTLCITSGNQAFISKNVGDLDTPEACHAHERTARSLLDWLGEKPQAIAHDLHPDFHSSRFAAQLAAELDVPLIAVQHHHAHIAAVCAEHGVLKPILGLALDGVGLGTDGTAWGGELLLIDWRSDCLSNPKPFALSPSKGHSWFDKLTTSGSRRIGHLRSIPLPGGDKAAQEPWRMAAAVLFQLGRSDEIAQRFPNQPAAQTVVVMLQRKLNCPITSSMGRLFDAAAGLLGVSEIQAFEAQAAIRLQELAQRHGQIAPLEGGYRIDENNVLDFLPLLAALADCPKENNGVGYGAALFHATLAAGLAEWVERAASRHNIADVALGGGCFHNDILLRTLSDRLATQGLRVLTARQMLPNDSAISLGQAWVALANLRGAAQE